MTTPDDEYQLLDDLLDPEVRDIEAPTADAAEQSAPVLPRDVRVAPPRTAFEANEYDAIEQSQVVDLDDDY